MPASITQPWNVREIFLQDVPEPVRLDLARVSRDAVKGAYVAKDVLAPQLRRDALGHDKRVLMQQGVLDLGTKHGVLNVSSGIRPNEVGNSHHAELDCGRVRIIAVQVDGPTERPRDAIYRETLATTNKPFLPGLGMPEQPPTGDKLLAVVLHGPSSAYPKSLDTATPGFVMVRFPAPGWTHWLEGRVDLLARLAQWERGEQPNWAVEPAAIRQAS